MKKLLLTLTLLLGLTAFSPVIAAAQPAPTTSPSRAAVCEGVGLTGGTCDDPTSGPTVDSTVKLAVDVLSIIVGIAAVIMIIIGGFKYIISSGDSSNITSAKNTILYAIIGLVIVALAQIIVTYVLNRTTGPVCKVPQTVQADGTCG